MIDIHPEDLLDREREGCLTSEERAYLQAHLLRCAACRIERQLALECAAERDLLDQELDDRARRSGDRSEPLPRLEPAPQDVPEPRAPSHAPRSVLRVRRGFPKAAVVSAALLLAGGAAALGGGIPWTRPVAPAASVTSVEPAPAVSVAGRKYGAGHRPGSRVIVPAPEPETPSSELEPTPQPELVDPAPAASPQRTRPPTPTARELFAQAAGARRDGDYQKALTLYGRVIERYPSSAEAGTARAVRARLLLDLGQTAAAEKGFREASKEDGPLSEAALVGQAQALRRAGKPAAERAVWQELLRRFPGSPRTAVARTRLEELGD
ncbi:MAG: tetratricopeptide repeat protein [Polyangiaceae bacterium]